MRLLLFGARKVGSRKQKREELTYFLYVSRLVLGSEWKKLLEGNHAEPTLTGVESSRLMGSQFWEF